MHFRRFSSNDVINITCDAIHLFVNKNINEFFQYLDDDFVFIADYDALFIHGAEEFRKYIEDEQKLPPVNIHQEEYEIIAHERHLWVSCGRYIVSLEMGGQTAVSKHHFEFTWRQVGNNLKLVHAMACHLRDFPPSEADADVQTEPSQARIFEFLPKQMMQNSVQEKIPIRDLSGKIRYIYPNEIIYIQAMDKICSIFTESETFSSRITLNAIDFSSLISVHKSFKVNKQYIKEICRYKVTLSNGVQLPVGKSKYMEVKKELFGE